jgi:hypothetical protein
LNAPLPKLKRFRRIVLLDFEFSQPPGYPPKPVCCVTLDPRTGRLTRTWLWGKRAACPYPVGPDTLVICYLATAELTCHLSLGWPLPANVLDLCIEFKRQVNGRPRGLGWKLTSALRAHGLDAMNAVEKHDLQMLAAGGGPYREDQERALLDYCESDVRSLERLLPKMLPGIDLDRALFRGRFMRAVARMEYQGIPIDTAALQALMDNWDVIRERLIADTNQHYHVWEGRSFKEARWERWLAERKLPWPRLKSGQLCLKDEVFRRMGELYPEVEPVRSLRSLLAQLREFELPIGPDGRARCMSGAFSTITGRNAARAREFIFLWPGWCRGLVQAPPGRALAYLDFSQQEYLIAGTLSGDANLIQNYRDGDCYLGLGD